MKDLAINKEDTESGVKNDLIIDTFDLSMVDGIEQIRQKLQIRLQFFYGEWYLDTTQGVKYFDEIFKKKLLEKSHEIEFLRKENYFSGSEYRFIKFICRKLIRINLPKESKDKGSFSFFFPFEVQIVDNENYQKNMTGPSEHQAYKERQQQAARKRVLPDFEESK